MAAEKDLVDALKQNDPGAFDQLISQHGAMLYRVASRIVGQREEAEEVLQESLLAVFEKVHTFNEQAALSTWLYRIVMNTALMRVRAKSRSREDLLDPGGPEFTEAGQFKGEVTDWDLSPEDTLLRQEALAVLQQGIEGLPHTYRAVYVLTEVEGLSQQEIANILDLTVSTVKVRLHRARLFLREALENYFVERRKKAE